MKIDFGTYHHTTVKESDAIRKKAGTAFSKLLRPLYSSRAALEILDAGCGLGFLMSVAAKCFPKARITGVDVFKRGSLTEISMDKAASNMVSLGIGYRTAFMKHDLTKAMKPDAQYDLAVSNLVFHNLGKRRFKAYTTVLGALKRGGFFVIGDLFPHDKADMDYFRECATVLSELHKGGSRPRVYKIRVLKKHR